MRKSGKHGAVSTAVAKIKLNRNLLTRNNYQDANRCGTWFLSGEFPLPETTITIRYNDL